MKNITKKIVLLGSLTASSLMMTACHQNPLKSHSERENVATLQEAARVAEKESNLPSLNRGRTYFNCMKGKPVDIGCKRFFEQMLAALKKKQGYEDMSLTDLTDKKSFASLADAYEDKLFNTID